MCGLRSLFDSQNDLDELGIWALKVNPDPVLIATEGALWGSVKAHGFLYSRQSALTMIALGFCPHYRPCVHVPQVSPTELSDAA